MTEPALDPLEAILRQCASNTPQPWYPSRFARERGVTRDSLDPFLDHLRLGGLIRLTEWVKDLGQGYVLTDEGKQVLENSRQLKRLLDGTLKLPLARQEEVEEAPQAVAAPTVWDQGEVVRFALLDQVPPVATVTLLILNLGMFLVGFSQTIKQGAPIAAYLGLDRLLEFGGGNQKVIDIQHELGAMRGIDIAEGEWGRLLLHSYVHYGLIHLAFNMYMLYAMGPLLEQIWGRYRFLILYHLAAFGGGCAAVLTNPFTIVAGASGAIWGLLASLIMWLVLNRGHLPAEMVSQWLRRLVALVLVNALFSFLPQISAAGHFGGGGVGALAAIFLNEQRFSVGLRKWAALAGLFAIPVVGVVAIIRAPLINPQWDQLDIMKRETPSLEAQKRAIAIWEEKVVPAQRQPARGYDLASIRRILEGYRDYRREEQTALALFENAGPYRDVSAEKERQRLASSLRDRLDHHERAIWKDVALPFSRDNLRAAARLYHDRFIVLSAQPPAERDTTKVNALIKDLEFGTTILNQTADLFDSLGTMEVDALDREKQKETERLRARAKLNELATGALRKGAKWSAQEEKQLDEQQETVRRLEMP